MTPAPKPEEIDFLDPNKPRTLNADQAQAANPTFAARNPELAALQAYRFDPSNLSTGTNAGRWIRPWAVGANKAISPLFNHGAVAGAAAGGALGYGTGWLVDRLSRLLTGGDLGLSWKLGLLGLGGGAMTGYHRKTAAVNDQVALLVKQDPTLTQYERALILQHLAQQPAIERQRLTRLALQVGGAGLGALIARHMLGQGLMSMALGGFAGSLAGTYMGQDRNVAGQPIRPAYL